MKKIIHSIIALLSFQLSIAQSSETKIDMVASNGNVTKEATFEKFDNRETLVLKNGRKGMIKVTILYPNGDGKTFDMDYYSNNHMPMIANLLGDSLALYEIDKGLAGRSPDEPVPYLAIGYLYFDKLSTFQHSFGPHAEKIRGDVPNYTNILPVVQISEVLIHASEHTPLNDEEIIEIGDRQAIFQSSEKKIEMVASNWNVTKEATFEKFDSRETLVLKGGRITAKNQKFTNGIIEVDVYANSIRSFAGITFRKQNNIMEEVYMRLHKSNQADAVQYTPIFNNESNWQLYREHQAKVSFKNKGWNALRIEVNNDNAEVFVNNDKVMSITNLRTNNISGEIGLFAGFSNRFSNFRITPKDAVEKTKKDSNLLVDSTIITKWEITKSKPYKAEELHFENFLKEEYITVETEVSGLLPISKYIQKSSSGNFEQNAEDYIVASTTVYTSNDETKLFSFDYSDRIIVYLNGKAVFKGNNAFRTKGIQYMGHIDINTNKLYLPLEKGANKIHCVVIDKANGWGLIAKLE